VVIKQRLIAVLNDVLGPIREKREALARDPKRIMEILKAGTEKARAEAQKTMSEVKRALKIDYFE
jgi:tryptophanyl-tRNA synthetase